jgi:hypothetical protein
MSKPAKNFGQQKTSNASLSAAESPPIVATERQIITKSFNLKPGGIAA